MLLRLEIHKTAHDFTSQIQYVIDLLILNDHMYDLSVKAGVVSCGVQDCAAAVAPAQSLSSGSEGASAAGTTGL